MLQALLGHDGRSCWTRFAVEGGCGFKQNGNMYVLVFGELVAKDDCECGGHSGHLLPYSSRLGESTQYEYRQEESQSRSDSGN